MSVRRRVFEILEASDRDDKFSRVVDLFILVLIGLNVIAVLLETVKSVYVVWGPYFRAFEVFSIVVFSIEYVLRLWSCTENPRYSRPLLGRLRFVVSLMGLVDFLAIAPFFIAPYVDLRFLRILRMFRLFRLAKVARYSSVLNTFGEGSRGQEGRACDDAVVHTRPTFAQLSRDVLHRESGTARKILEHPRGDVVGCLNTNDGRIRRRLSRDPCG